MREACAFPFSSRTAARLPASLFVGNRLHTLLDLHRTARGYEAVISPDLQSYLQGDAVQRRGVAVDDLDMPRAQPLLYRRDDGWSLHLGDSTNAESMMHDLAVAARPRVDLWATDSVSTALTTLLAMGYDLHGLAQVIHIDFLGRPAHDAGVERLANALRLGAANIGRSLIDLVRSDEYGTRRHSLAEPRGLAAQTLIPLVPLCHTPRHRAWKTDTRPQFPIDYSPMVALTGGWWSPDREAGTDHHWSSYSAAIVVRPSAAGRWILRAQRSDRDAGLRIRRWRVQGEPGLQGTVFDGKAALDLDFHSPTGEPLVLEFEVERFFVPSEVTATDNHRSLALCFSDFHG